MKTVKIDNSEIFYGIARHGEIPSKFSYVGDGAHYWENLTKKWSHAMVNTNAEAKLLNDNALQIIETVRTLGSFKPSEVHIIDLGCGNGDPALMLCKNLSECMYTAVDISSEMIDIALQNIRGKVNSGIEYSSFVLDFETQNPKQIIDELCVRRHANLFMFVGNTLGNYPDPHGIISGIVGAMTDRDFLLVGNGLIPLSSAALVCAYDNEEERSLLTSTTNRLGVPIASIRFVWSSENEVQAIGVVAENIRLQHYSQSVQVLKGQELLLLRSRKYSQHSLVNLLTSAGITIVSKWANTERTHMLALCKPTFHRLH